MNAFCVLNLNYKFLYLYIYTIGEKLHAKRELALESIDFESFLLETIEELFEFVSLIMSRMMLKMIISK